MAKIHLPKSVIIQTRIGRTKTRQVYVSTSRVLILCMSIQYPFIFTISNPQISGHVFFPYLI